MGRLFAVNERMNERKIMRNARSKSGGWDEGWEYMLW